MCTRDCVPADARVVMKTAAILMIGLAGLLGASASRATAACVGTLSYLAINNAGSLYVDVGYGIWGVCGIRTALTSGGVTIEPETCRAWYAAFLAAQKSTGSIRLYFHDPISSCAAIGTWVVPNPLPYHMDSVG